MDPAAIHAVAKTPISVVMASAYRNSTITIVAVVESFVAVQGTALLVNVVVSTSWITDVLMGRGILCGWQWDLILR